MTDEEQAKINMLVRAKEFINHLKFIINEIEVHFDSKDDFEQITGIINALAMSRCLTEYHAEAEKIDAVIRRNKGKSN